MFKGKLIYISMFVIFIIVFVICIAFGSVNVDINHIIGFIKDLLIGKPIKSANGIIILNIRLPRVICAALVGAGLSIAGCAMQGLLRNPLADGSSLGVASAASLGSVLSIAMGFKSPIINMASNTIFAIAFAFMFLMLILAISYSIDKFLSSHTIILMGIIFSMFISAAISLIIAFSGEKLKGIIFWTMGSFSSSNYNNVILLMLILIPNILLLLSSSVELNAFALGEDKAQYIGINTKISKLKILISCSAIIGTAVSISGNIAFVGLIIPHISRLILGADHRKTLPISAIMGAMFLMLCDLIARSILKPIELPIGVISSLIGTIVFIIVFYKSRRS